MPPTVPLAVPEPALEEWASGQWSRWGDVPFGWGREAKRGSVATWHLLLGHPLLPFPALEDSVDVGIPRTVCVGPSGGNIPCTGFKAARMIKSS